MSSNIILVTGGSRSGKSTFAEKLYDNNDDVTYIATAIITDDEMESRIKIHQETRNHNWKTIEQYKDLHKRVEQIDSKNILLDCVTVMISNLIFDSDYNFDQVTHFDIIHLEKEITTQFELLIKEVRLQNKNLVLVTNEVGYGLVSEYKLGRIFSDITGRVNQKLALWSNEVYLVACGLPIKLK